MILNSIFLALEYKEFSQDLKLKVKDQSRHITYYLQRKLKEIKYQTTNFNRIVIELSEIKPKGVYINSEKVACVTIPFKEKELLDIESENKIQDFYGEKIMEGLIQLSKKHEIPLGYFCTWLQDLKKKNYKNEWTYQKKNFRGLKLDIELRCIMNLTEFNLILSIKINEELIYNKIILKTPPDEVAFHYRFKDIVFKDEKIIITSRTQGDKPLIELPVPEIFNYD